MSPMGPVRLGPFHEVLSQVTKDGERISRQKDGQLLPRKEKIAISKTGSGEPIIRMSAGFMPIYLINVLTGRVRFTSFSQPKTTLTSIWQSEASGVFITTPASSYCTVETKSFVTFCSIFSMYDDVATFDHNCTFELTFRYAVRISWYEPVCPPWWHFDRI